MIKSGVNSARLLGAVFTVSAIALLLIVGPASAFDLVLDGLKNDPYKKGENVVFTAKVLMNTNERLDMSNVSLEIKRGGFSKICVFDLAGNPMNNCEGVDIDLINNDFDFGYGFNHIDFNNQSYDFGYGYGQGYSGSGVGALIYNVTIVSGTLEPRNYDMWLVVSTPSAIFKSSKYDFTISNGKK